MLNFVRISMPTPLAIRLAEETDPRTCADTGYVIKSALAEVFADGAVRPWRTISMDSDLIVLVGFAGDADVSVNAKARKLGMSIDHMSFPVKDGEILRVTVQSSAMRGIKYGEGSKNRKFVDVGATLIEGTYLEFEPTPAHLRIPLWGEWVVGKLSAPGSGVSVIDVPQDASTSMEERVRKIGSKLMPIKVPVIDCTLTVRVNDRDAFRATVAHGLGKFKDVGLGSVIPAEVLEDFA